MLHRFFAGPSPSLLPLVLLGGVIGILSALIMFVFLNLLNLTLGWLNGANLPDWPRSTSPESG